MPTISGHIEGEPRWRGRESAQQGARRIRCSFIGPQWGNLGEMANLRFYPRRASSRPLGPIAPATDVREVVKPIAMSLYDALRRMPRREAKNWPIGLSGEGSGNPGLGQKSNSR